MGNKNIAPEVSETFAVNFSGDALNDHSMSVSDLAPSLLSMERLLKELNLLVNEGTVRIEVNVTTVKAGSVEATLVLQYFWENIKNLITSEDGETIFHLVELALFSKGVLGWAKKFRGKTPERLSENSDGTTEVILDGKNSKINTNVYRAYMSPRIRRELSEIVKPLKKKGISSVGFIVDGELLESVAEAEAKYLAYDSESLEPVEEYITHLSIVKLSFDRKYTWRFSSLGEPITAHIKDREFLDNVDNNAERFTKGDFLKCLLQRKQVLSDDGTPKTQYVVLRVLKHIRAEKQMRLAE